MKKVHFLGILGSGASAAAKIAEAQGFKVSGCDKDLEGHSPDHIKNIDILAVTPAIYSLDPKNQELLEAKNKNIPIMTWQDFMGKFLQKHKFVIAVAGTHGKSTTTAMIGQLLEDAGLDPTTELGAEVPRWRANFRIGKSKLFVCEADEYNDNFLNFHPDIAAVTNIEMDHPEYFKDFRAVQKSFDKFKAQSKKVFDQPDPKLIDFPLQVPGDFNILNASLAYQIGLKLGIKKDIIKKSLQNYTGTLRRFEYLGDFKGSKIYTDFGHHPTEIKVTMQAARQKFPGSKILLIFEPHMFTRTYKLFDNFVKVFKEITARHAKFQRSVVDKIIITDIYQSREVDKGLVNSKQLADSINKKNAIYIPKKDLKNYLEKEIKVMDVIFFMGAGDIDKIARSMVKKNVLILGLGLNEGGAGSAKFFASQNYEVRVTDLKNKHELKKSLDQLKHFKSIRYTLGKHKYEDIDWADLIIRNPALRPYNPYLEYARKKGKLIEMDMGIFLQYVRPDQIIGVTGTKGKSTTASLIYEVLKNTKKNIIFAGNIGKSVLDATSQITKDSLIVLELSSFQLQAFREHQVSPKWAVITNIFPDHLNYYQNMEDYVKDKKAISEFQTKEDFLFVKKDSLFSTKGKTIYFSKKDLPDDYKPKLMGEHNLENIAAALAVVKQFGIDEKIALKILANFAGVEFRLQLTKTWQGVKIYNDSAATNPESTIQALKTLPNCILIVGGVNKNLPYKSLAEAIKKYTKKVYFLEGSATEVILKNNPPAGGLKIYNNLEKVLQDIKKVVKPGDIILFSPAAASFNLFQNEFDRGRKFNTAVRKVFK